ncbi:hypothetical protein WH47_10464 [Habropoda laboriosa]|uniref:Uncharacterized protein n=2 Tax=Habropoda laboriosa TaxID=597456 RepID=A0A0L7QMM3_9HYME|nr:PREDICTED: uncharacterized protein LOC108577335 isoform X2 [Habropoda laboriosa]KOC59835.1 hypothetical protein WH47_10464 [Habropoda laboriosa]
MVKPLYWMNLTTTMRCRPEDVNTLLCRFDHVRMLAFVDQQPTDIVIDYPFKIEFSPRGIEKLRLPEEIDDKNLFFLRNIVKDLSIGADLRENADSLPVFIAKQNYVIAGCATLFTVLNHDQVSNQTRNYDLQILPLPGRRPDSVVVIEKITEHKKCAKPGNPSYSMQKMNYKIKTYVSRMQIGDTTFNSQTRMHMEMKTKELISIRDISYVELVDIERATEPMPQADFDHVATLYFE